MNQESLSKKAFSTVSIHAGQHKDPVNGALVTPIFQTTTFAFDTVDEIADIHSGKHIGAIYTRVRNPTSQQLEDKLSAIEGAEAALVTASGIGAIGSTLLTFLGQGDHIVVSDVVYGITTLLLHHLERFGITCTSVNMTDLDAVRGAVRENTRVIYAETPANPTMQITDIAACAKLAHEKGALLIVDSTFAPPPAQYCYRLGADLVIHSTTKYLNGHGDAIGGVVIGSRARIEQIRDAGIKSITGACASPFNSWLVLRGMKTLDLRMRQHCAGALAVARFLEQHPYVRKVNYPGLESHPQHELAMQQMHGLCGGVVTFELCDDIHGVSGYEACKTLLNSLELCSLAVSLGDADTLIEHPASMTHRLCTPEEKQRSHISDSMIRLSVGLESPDDIIEDLKQGLAKI